ncbi:Carboxylesterase type B [Penicillium concentricum]|uniref:Carboxylic ester hydrolase n=1 Tax=Penicillium concentricum TaxID=293559 RepID=A0A9W9SQK9_9EURO|nr:Carboxylesterase type B [Penicillium concentricum]KAJ5382848.1 Carboxylesterase type B [Penicillium concentricum]
MKLALAALLPAFAAAVLYSPSVAIDAGTVQGGRCEDGQNAVFYKAIPFAEPPTKELRFEPPKAYKRQFPRGRLNATTAAATCIQFSDDFTPKRLNASAHSSEDCLYLNIWAPSNATKGSKLPVKIWVYGGSETEGSISDPLYDGCNTAEAGSILVSINYRLGPLGFMALETAGIYGNQGIQDLLLGLEWVHDNIAAFGGDPKKVLLFGQSAGAENVYIIGSLPQAPSLINSIISESGGGRRLVSNSTQQKVGASFAQTLKCSSGDKACLQSKTVSDLLIAYSADTFLTQGIGYYGGGSLSILSQGTHNFYPYVDGNVIKEDPYDRGVQVPAVFGSNSNEAIVYTLQWAAKYQQNPTKSVYKDFLRSNFGNAASLVGKAYSPSLFKSEAKAIIAATSQFAQLGYNTTSLEILLAMTQIITDSSYRCSAWYGAAQAARNNIPAWTYTFSHNPTCPWLFTIDESDVSLFGGAHTAEIPFVFGNLDNSYLPNGTCNSTSGEWHLGDQMMDLWTAMAENAKPSTKEINWPQFQTQGKNLSTPSLIFENSILAGTIDYTGCDLWVQVNAMLSASNATATGTPTKANGDPTFSPSSLPSNGAISLLSRVEGYLAFSVLFMGLAAI